MVVITYLSYLATCLFPITTYLFLSPPVTTYLFSCVFALGTLGPRAIKGPGTQGNI